VHRFVVLLGCGLLLLVLTSGLAQAGIRPPKRVDLRTVAQIVAGKSTRPSAESPSQGQPSKKSQARLAWSRRDTAVYVVSTLNLLRTAQGRPLPTTLQRRGVASFDVYADSARPDLYFIVLVRANEDVAGALAYHMGWLKPQSISSLTDKLGVRSAQEDIARAYTSDLRLLIGSFTSTLPS